MGDEVVVSATVRNAVETCLTKSHVHNDDSNSRVIFHSLKCGAAVELSLAFQLGGACAGGKGLKANRIKSCPRAPI